MRDDLSEAVITAKALPLPILQNVMGRKDTEVSIIWMQTHPWVASDVSWCRLIWGKKKKSSRQQASSGEAYTYLKQELAYFLHVGKHKTFILIKKFDSTHINPKHYRELSLSY